MLCLLLDVTEGWPGLASLLFVVFMEVFLSSVYPGLVAIELSAFGTSAMPRKEAQTCVDEIEP